MKVTPIPSSSPRLLEKRDVPTETPTYSVRIEAVFDPATGDKYMTMGIGGEKRMQRAILTKQQVAKTIADLSFLLTHL